MADDDRMAPQRRQIAMLFAYPGIGPLSDGAVAKNLGVSPQEIRPALDAMVADGALLRCADNRFARSSESRERLPERGAE